MKKIIILLLICFIKLQSSAQTRLMPGEMKGKHDTFIIHKLKPFDSVNYIVVYSKGNKYNNGIPSPKVPHFIPMSYLDTHVDNKTIKQIVYTVLNKKLAALKQNKETMTTNFDFYPNGQICDASFGLHENTLITLQDIEEIDQELRATLKATFTGKQYLQYEVIYYSKSPSFVF